MNSSDWDTNMSLCINIHKSCCQNAFATHKTLHKNTQIQIRRQVTPLTALDVDV